MTDDVETRRRRAVYRACHRGTKEMDWILGRFAQAALAGMPTDGLGLFERMLALPDPDLQDMILHPELMPAGEFAELVAAMRVFHGLDGSKQ
jgi:antitoxin CptB